MNGQNSRDFAALVVVVMVVIVVATVGQLFLEIIRGPEVRAGSGYSFINILVGLLQIFGFVIPAIMFIRYGRALLRGERFFKVEDENKQQPVEDTAEEQL